MFGRKKKQPKVEKLFDNENQEAENPSEADVSKEGGSEEKLSKVDEFVLGIDNGSNDDDEFHLTDAQKEKVDKLDNVKDKISKILQSQNIEIVDENFGDEYESEFSSDSDEKKQQDYDSLKALFGEKSKNKTEELTLTIDDFDYTYVGQYVDEFDLMHMKNIKKIKLKKKYPKHLKKILIAASVVVAVGLGAFFGFYFTRDIPVTLQSISLNQTEHDYYLNQSFEYDELYIYAKYSNGVVKKIPLTGEYITTIYGVYNRNGDDIKFLPGAKRAELIINYKGQTVTYTVNVKEKVLSGISSLYAPDLFNLDAGEYITDKHLKILLDYGDYGREMVDFSLSGLKLFVDGTEMEYSVDKTDKTKKGFLLTKNITSSSIIKITYSTATHNVTYGG